MREWLDSPTEAPPPATGSVLREYDSVVAEVSQRPGAPDPESVTERHVVLARYVSEAAAAHPDVVGQRSAWVSETLLAVADARGSASSARIVLDRLVRELLSICEQLCQSTPTTSDAWVPDLVEFTAQTTEYADRLRALRVLAAIAESRPAAVTGTAQTLVSTVETTDEKELVARVLRETIPVGGPPNERVVSALFDWMQEGTGEQRATAVYAIRSLAIESPETAAARVERLAPLVRVDADRLQLFYARILLEASSERPEAVYSVAEPMFAGSAPEVGRKHRLMLYRALVQLLPERAAADVDWFFEELEASGEDVLYVCGHVLMLFAELRPEAYDGRVERVVELLHRFEGDKLEEVLAALRIVTDRRDVHLSETAADTLGSYLREPPTVRAYAASILESASVPETWQLPSAVVTDPEDESTEGTEATDGTRATVEEPVAATLSEVIEAAEAEVGELDPATEHVSSLPFGERNLYRDETVVELRERAEELADRRSPAVLSLLEDLVEYAQHDSTVITVQALRALLSVAETYPGMVASDLPAVIPVDDSHSELVLALQVRVLNEVVSSDSTRVIGIDGEMDDIVTFLVSVSQRSEPALGTGAVRCLRLICTWSPEVLGEHVGSLVAAIDTDRDRDLFLRGMILQRLALRESTLVRSHVGALLDVLQATDVSGNPRPSESVDSSGDAVAEPFWETAGADGDEFEPRIPYLIALTSVLQDDPGLVVTHAERLVEMLRAGRTPQTDYAAKLLRHAIFIHPDVAEEFLPVLGELVGSEKPVLCRRTSAGVLSLIGSKRPDLAAEQAPAVVSALERADGSSTGFVQDCLSTLAAGIHEIPEAQYPRVETIVALLQQDEAFREPAIKILSAFSHLQSDALRPYRQQFEAVCSDDVGVETKLAGIEVLMDVGSRAGGSR